MWTSREPQPTQGTSQKNYEGDVTVATMDEARGHVAIVRVSDSDGAEIILDLLDAPFGLKPERL